MHKLSKHHAWWGARSVLLLGVLIVACAAPAGALACGMPLAARIPSEQALIVFASGREEIITSVHLQSDGPGAAVIFPVPGVPEVGVLDSQELFGYLGDVTRPQERVEERIVWNGQQGPEMLAAGGAPGA